MQQWYGANNNMSNRLMLRKLSIESNNKENGDASGDISPRVIAHTECCSVIDGIDAVLFCTGYHYEFPFIDFNDFRFDNDNNNNNNNNNNNDNDNKKSNDSEIRCFGIDDNYVEPLWRHFLIPNKKFQTIAFIGIEITNNCSII